MTFSSTWAGGASDATRSIRGSMPILRNMVIAPARSGLSTIATLTCASHMLHPYAAYTRHQRAE